MNGAMKNIFTKSQSNLKASEKIESISLLCGNVWVSLIAPLLTGIFVAYYFQQGSSGLNFVVYAVIAVSLLVHMFFTWLIHTNNRKHSLSSEMLEIKEELTAKDAKIIQHQHSLNEISTLKSTQDSTLFILTNYIDEAIGQLNNVANENPNKVTIDDFNELFCSHLEDFVKIIMHKREDLFGYKSDSFYNAALYGYTIEKDSLQVLAREHDSRIAARNRPWKPGHGHVGLTWLHKQAKICPDIKNSHEMPQYDTVNSYYRSFFSIPILRCDDNGDMDNGLTPLGVFVLTSAHPDQFDRIRDFQFLGTTTKMIAIYLSYAESFMRVHSIGLEEDHAHEKQYKSTK